MNEIETRGHISMSPALFRRAEQRGVPLETIRLILSEGTVVRRRPPSELHWRVRGSKARVITVEGRAVSCYWKRRAGRKSHRLDVPPPEPIPVGGLGPGLDAYLAGRERAVRGLPALGVLAVVGTLLGLAGLLAALGWWIAH